MRKFLVWFFCSVCVYVFVLSLAHSYYLTKINQSMEITIQKLVSKIAEIQQENAWHDLNEGDLK